MRKNTALVLDSLNRGKPRRQCNAVHTDGHIVKSYLTPVCVPHPDENDHWLITEGGAHSVTTTVQTNGLACGIQHDWGCKVTRVPQSEIDRIVREHY